MGLGDEYAVEWVLVVCETFNLVQGLYVRDFERQNAPGLVGLNGSHDCVWIFVNPKLTGMAFQEYLPNADDAHKQARTRCGQRAGGSLRDLGIHVEQYPHQNVRIEQHSVG